MHIKQVIIQGFKSYRDQTVIDPFSPNHNVVVGRNGSGKSNFFSAIRFVLSDAYTLLSEEERKSLLHEGVGPTTLSAYVEIIFDNSDHRFPTGKDEVILRRTIGAQKDEYTLDRKTVTKADVMNLLESAGFSRSNPYYIVPQGRVTSLTHAKDSERLQLLKEVAGTRVYENKRQESIKIMEETESKRAKIDELIGFIQERLSELEAEKQELAIYQENDKIHRCLEYALYSQEQKNILDLLIDMKESREKVAENELRLQDQFYKRDESINNLEQNILEIQQQQEILQVENKQLNEEFQEQIKTKVKVELEISDIQNNGQEGGQAREKLERDLAQVESQIASAEQQIAQLTPELNEATKEENELQEKLEKDEQIREILYSKKARGTQFETKDDRDRYLNNEIHAYGIAIKAENENINILEKEIQTHESDLQNITNGMGAINKMLNDQKEEIQRVVSEASELKKSLDEQSDKRKELWREEAKLDTSVHNYQEQLKKLERGFAGTMDQNTAVGLAAVRRIVQEKGITGVFGTIYELMEVDETFSVAAEVTAGQRLFHILVDTDKTAATLIGEMNRRKEGRVTFIPLNRIKSKAYDYTKATNAVPLIDQIKFNNRFTKAFQLVFGNTIVCETIEIASSYARNFGFDTITLEGDRADGRGALIGGYYDSRLSRLDFITKIKEIKETLENEISRSRSVKAEIRELDQRITNTLSEVQRTESEKKKILSLRDPLFADLSSKQRQIAYLKETIKQKNYLCENRRNTIKKLETRIDQYRQELRTPLSSTLSDQEIAHLEQLDAEIDSNRTRFSSIFEKRNDLEMKVLALTDKLQSNLERRRIDLSRQIEGMIGSLGGTRGSILESKQNDLSLIESSIEQIKQLISENDEKLETSNRELEDIQKQISDLKTTQMKASRELELQQKNFEQYLSRKSLLIQKREACAKNIRELGVLPEEAFTMFVKEDFKQVMRRLQEVNATLKEYSHVNKKAAEQFNKFNQQKELLISRKKELDESRESIQELIESLDKAKDAAIERTFKAVSMYFEKIFKALVPNGKGVLIMQRRNTSTTNNDDDDDDDESAPTTTSKFDNCIGIAIKVSFNSESDEGLRIQQLSGGQKSLVALTLIFAIQRCDPAPFYLFDEIDANLDTAYRTALARVIHNLSRDAQFITTTFRPELLANADKFYGVSFTDKVSRISVISKEDATTFLEGDYTQ